MATEKAKVEGAKFDHLTWAVALRKFRERSKGTALSLSPISTTISWATERNDDNGHD
jgi:hypothetical protein